MKNFIREFSEAIRNTGCLRLLGICIIIPPMLIGFSGLILYLINLLRTGFNMTSWNFTPTDYILTAILLMLVMYGVDAQKEKQ